MEQQLGELLHVMNLCLVKYCNFNSYSFNSYEEGGILGGTWWMKGREHFHLGKFASISLFWILNIDRVSI